jgi:UDPglucose 6-dehydrogenase
VREVVRKHAKHHISVVSNPEFLKEGDAVNDFLKPDRIVVGTDDDKAFEALSRLYAPFNRQRNRLQRMSPKSAEIVKYAANALLATKISFMNEIARLCDVAGGDAEHVRLAVGSDERIGMQFLYPGLGFGGSCFPKDLRALVQTGKELDVELTVANAAWQANAGPVTFLIRHMEGDLGGLKDKVIAVWGLAFKPRTDDMREAPAITIIERLLQAGAKVQAFDPEAMKVAKGIFGSKLSLVDRSYDALKGADALAVVTEWNEFREPDFARMRKLLRSPVIFDGRNIYRPAMMKEQGFTYYAIGR